MNIFNIKTLILLGILFIVGCGDANAPYVEVDGTRYTESDIKSEMPDYYASIRKDYNKQLQRALSRLGEKKLFEEAADDADLDDSQAYIRSLQQKAASNPTDEEIKSTYDTLKKQGQIKTQSLESVRGQLISYIRSRASRDIIQNKLAELKKEYDYKLGPDNRVKVDIVGEPTLSPNGKVTVVEFSGFECSYCKKVQSTTRQVREKYGDKVTWVFKDYPLNLSSLDAHLAASCVYQQDADKFWDFFNALYAPSSDRSELQKKKLVERAASLDIDMKRFDECLNSSSTREEILADHDQGRKLGINGIPHFFINGKPLAGAQPFQKFEEIISVELAK